MDNEELRNEVIGIRGALTALENRLLLVEKSLTPTAKDLSKEPVLVSKPLPLTKPMLENMVGPEPALEVKQPIISSNNLETRIGQYWLNKLGVISLVIGVVFLILYSFQYFGAPLKLLTGVAIASFLIILGERMARDECRKWYGHGLMGGGWALVYFIVYAMYFIPDLKMIDFYPLEFGLLISVCGAAMLQAIYRRAEMISILAVTLANLSIGLSGPSMISNVPILVIAVLGSLVALRNNWYVLFAWLVAASYIGHSFAGGEAYTYSASTSMSIGWAAAAYLSSLWFIINIAMLFAKEDTTLQRKTIIIVSCINALAFGMCMFALANDYFIQQRSWIIGLAGALYLILAPLVGVCQLNRLKTANILIGLSFVNIAIWMKFTGAPVAIFNLFEMGLLTAMGLHFDIKAFRWFALYLSICFFPLWLLLWVKDSYSQFTGTHSDKFILVGALATAVFAVICWLYRRQKYLAMQGSGERRSYKQIYFCLANFTAWLTPFALDEVMNAVVLWSLQPIVSSIFSIEGPEFFYGQIAMLQVIYACLALLFNIVSWQWLPAMFIVLACFAFYAYVRQKERVSDRPFIKNAKQLSIIISTAVLTILFLQKLSSFWLSTGLALEGLGLVAVGFILRDRLFRIPGLLVLALLVLKLLFVDLAKADTPQRIVSFIAAGIVFLIASYTYSKFAEKFADSEFNR